jgi:hypothetical protein
MINKFAKLGMLLWTILCLLGNCSVMFSLANRPSGDKDVDALAMGMGMGVWFFIWFFPMIVLGIVALVTRPSKGTTTTAMATASGGPRLCPHCGKYFEGPGKFCPLCGKPQLAEATSATSLP